MSEWWFNAVLATMTWLDNIHYPLFSTCILVFNMHSSVILCYYTNLLHNCR